MIASDDLIITSLANLTDGTSRPSGCMLLERMLQEMFLGAFTQLKEDPAPVINDLFYKLNKKLRDDIIAYFTTNAVTVRLNYPEVGYAQPMVAINNQADDEAPQNDVLGNYMGGGAQEEVGGNQLAHIEGFAERSRYNLMCFAGKDSNACLWLYYLVKAIVLANTQLLVQHGVNVVTMSGQDLSFQEERTPEMPYMRVVALTCDHYFSLQVTEPLASTLQVQTFTDSTLSAIKLSLST